MPMQPEWVTLITTVPSIAIAVLFAIFVFKLLDRQDKKDLAREQLEEKRRQDDKTRQDEREGEWRMFIAEARGQYLASIANVTAELKVLTNSVNTTNTLLTNHDTWERMARSRAEAGQGNTG